MKELALSISQFGKIQSVTPTFELSNILSTFASLLLVLIAILSLLFLIWGGLDIILAEGDKQRVASARQKITFAVIGLIVALLSFFIVTLIGNIFGVNLLNLVHT